MSWETSTSPSESNSFPSLNTIPRFAGEFLEVKYLKQVLIPLLLYSYEPEIHPGAVYKWKEQKASLTIFQTGAMTLTAPSVAAVDAAVQHIYPLVFEFKKEKPMNSNLAHVKALKLQEDKTGSKRKGCQPTKKLKKRRTSYEEEVEGFLVDSDEESGPISDEEEAVFTSDEEDE